MKAVQLLGNKKSEVVDVPEPEPVDHLVVVKVMSSVICGTEHHGYYAPGPSPMHGGSGHEAAGIVAKVDKAKGAREGDRVSIVPVMSEVCHRCPACSAGEWLHCRNPSPRKGISGTHSQYVLVPDYLCLPIPADMSFDNGAMIGDCIGTPYRAIRRLGVKAGDTVLITGAGPIGATAAIITKYRNARVIVVDVNDYRLGIAKENGADYVFNPTKDDVLAQVTKITGGLGVDAAVECSGNKDAQLQCLDAARACGGVAFLGIKNETVSVDMGQHFVLKELTLIGSWASSIPDQYEIIDQIQQGMPTHRIITHRFGMDDAPKALDTFFNGQGVKIAIHPWGDGD